MQFYVCMILYKNYVKTLKIISLHSNSYSCKTTWLLVLVLLPSLFLLPLIETMKASVSVDINTHRGNSTLTKTIHGVGGNDKGRRGEQR